MGWVTIGGAPTQTRPVPESESEFSRTLAAYVRYYVGLLHDLGPCLYGKTKARRHDQFHVLALLQAEAPNLIGVVDAALQERDEEALTVLFGYLPPLLDAYGDLRGLLSICNKLLDTPAFAAIPQLRCCALLGQAKALWRYAVFGQAQAACSEALRLADQHRLYYLLTQALRLAGEIATAQGKADEARELYEEAIRVAEEHNDNYARAWTLTSLAKHHYEHGNIDIATQQLAAAMTLAKQAENHICASQCLSNGAMFEVRRGNLAQAERMFGQALELKRNLCDQRGESICLANLGAIAMDRSDFAGAVNHYEAGLRLVRHVGDRYTEAAMLSNLGMAEIELGLKEQGIERLQAAYQMHVATGHKLGQATVARFLATTFLKLGDDAAALPALRQAQEAALACAAVRDIAINIGLVGSWLTRHAQAELGHRLVACSLKVNETRNLNYEADILLLLQAAGTAARGDLAELTADPQELGRLALAALH